jgi:hypothetical protein
MSIVELVRDLPESSCSPSTLSALGLYSDITIYRWDGHRIMYVDRVRFEVIREGTKKQLRHHTALLYIEVVLDLVITPVGQVLCIVVDLDSILSRGVKEKADMDLLCRSGRHGQEQRHLTKLPWILYK